MMEFSSLLLAAKLLQKEGIKEEDSANKGVFLCQMGGLTQSSTLRDRIFHLILRWGHPHFSLEALAKVFRV